MFALTVTQYLVAICGPIDQLLMLAMSIHQHSWWVLLECPLERQVLCHGVDHEKCGDDTWKGGDTPSLWRSTWQGHSSEKEYEYSEPLVKLQTLRVTLMNALRRTSHAIHFVFSPDNYVTVTTQTWIVNLSGQPSGIYQKFCCP